jgi:uncharacterized protein YecE (DUF72 family)
MTAPRRIFVGTSGWTYDDWSGVFYPEEIKAADRLAYYVGKFPTVEVNATFYRTPTQNMIDAWNRKLPAKFHLVIKGPRVVTHRKKLVDCDEPLEIFLERAGQLKRLRVILWQLPPSLHKDLDRLGRFLDSLPRIRTARGYVRHAVEFRHVSWWDADVTELLRQHAAAFVAVSHPQLPDTISPTCDFIYVRFHGLGEQLYRYDYSQHELAQWAARLRPLLRRRRLYAFFNNDYAARAPCNAPLLMDLLDEHSKILGA